jgi:hypothetical protein
MRLKIALTEPYLSRQGSPISWHWHQFPELIIPTEYHVNMRIRILMQGICMMQVHHSGRSA